MRYFYYIFGFSIVALISCLGLRGWRSQEPPVWLFPDMDYQDKYLPQGRNHFFADQRHDRPKPAGTVARGSALDLAHVLSPDYRHTPSDQPALYSGKLNEQWLRGFPIDLTADVLHHGQKQYTLFCQICHGASGDGNGVTKAFGMVATASYHDDRIRQMPEGEIFNTILHGKNTMRGYADKVTPQDAWAIVSYVRALQRSQHARIEDVPAHERHLLPAPANL
jgi:mono/diheme cytochrome c family protein